MEAKIDFKSKTITLEGEATIDEIRDMLKELNDIKWNGWTVKMSEKIAAYIPTYIPYYPYSPQPYYPYPLNPPYTIC